MNKNLKNNFLIFYEFIFIIDQSVKRTTKTVRQDYKKLVRKSVVVSQDAPKIDFTLKNQLSESDV